MKNKISKTSERGVTLIALIITVIILIILAAVTLRIAMGDRLVDTTLGGVVEYTEASANEKIEMALSTMIAKKVSDRDKYNSGEYLEAELRKEGIELTGNIAIVNGWVFEIDREVPKIIKNLGGIDKEIKISSSQIMEDKYSSSKITIEITSDKKIVSISIAGKEITDIKKDGDKYIVETNIESNGNYNIIVKDEENKYNISTINVNEIAENMTINSKEEWNKFNEIAQKGGTFKGKTVSLNTKIDLEGKKHTPIPLFEGIFEGNNNIIDNLTIEKIEMIQDFLQLLMVQLYKT